MAKLSSLYLTVLAMAVAVLCVLNVAAAKAQPAGSFPTSSEAVPPFHLSSPTPLMLTLVQGQAGMATVSLSSEKAFGEEIKLGCTGTGPGLQCLVSPQSITLTPGETSNATIAVATQGASTTNLRSEVDRGWPSKSTSIRTMAGAVGLCYFLYLRRRRTRLPLLLVMGLMGSLFIAGCYGGKTEKQAGTPIGETALHITAAAGPILQSKVLMVTVTQP